MGSLLTIIRGAGVEAPPAISNYNYRSPALSQVFPWRAHGSALRRSQPDGSQRLNTNSDKASPLPTQCKSTVSSTVAEKDYRKQTDIINKLCFYKR